MAVARGIQHSKVVEDPREGDQRRPARGSTGRGADGGIGCRPQWRVGGGHGDRHLDWEQRNHV
jgi:hypothetical protein